MEEEEEYESRAIHTHPIIHPMASLPPSLPPSSPSLPPSLPQSINKMYLQQHQSSQENLLLEEGAIQCEGLVLSSLPADVEAKLLVLHIVEECIPRTQTILQLQLQNIRGSLVWTRLLLCSFVVVCCSFGKGW